VLVVSHDRALLDAVPDRIVAIEDRALHSYDGGWADLQLARSARAAEAEAPPKPPPTKTSKPEPPRAPTKRKRLTELELVEARIAEAEARVEELERALAADWTNMDALSAHRAARDQLTELLARWEQLFESAQSRAP
jgi:ATP-binding cassette subfamily F protein 3